MHASTRFEVYFRRPNDAVVFRAATDEREISLVHRYGDGHWHCALCNDTECQHVRAARSAHEGD